MKQLLKHIIILIVLGIFSVGNLLAQDSTFKVSIASPTAASLGKYGDIPISYHTGIPNISIPIYTVQSGTIETPISLSYHASGLKVQENASWVGAGWSLNAGGVITRTVIGEPDDRGFSSNKVNNGHYSDYGYNNYLFIPWGTIVPQVQNKSVALPDGKAADDISFVYGLKDGEPDMFFFNFGSYSGKFYFNDDRTPVFVPEADFKVQTDFVAGTGFNGFIITATDGTKYYFGNTGNTATVAPIEVSTPSTIQNGPANSTQCISAWYLNKIISADGIDSVKFSYAQESYSNFTMSMFPVMAGTVGVNYLTSAQLPGCNPVKNFITGVRLSQIAFPNGSVVFNPASAPRTDLAAGYTTNTGFYDAANNSSYALGNINITGVNGFSKKYNFSYGYFNDPNPLSSSLTTLLNSYNVNSDANRLRLDSVQEISGDGTASVPPYKFSYYAEPVPRKLSLGIDHWGFSNGATYNNQLIPTLQVQNGLNFTQIFGATRDAAWPAMRGGTLQQITYPTGGYTQLIYGPHDTWGSYNTYVENSRASVSVEYDGSTYNQATYTTSATSGSSIFELDVSSTSAAVTGTLQIYQGSTFITSAATNTSNNFVLSPNTTYTLKFYGTKSGTGWGGATATLNEWVQTVQQGNMMVGGLRIDSLINYDPVASNTILTAYSYGGAHSNGILYSRPTYIMGVRNDWEQLAYPTIFINGGPSATGAYVALSPGSILPMATTQGNHIGYSQVTVSQAGNGSSIYRYYGSNIWDLNTNDVCQRTLNTTTTNSTWPSYPYQPLPFEFMRGELKYEGQYNQGGQLLKEKWYFPQYAQSNLTTPGYIPIGAPFYTGTVYQLQSAYKVRDSVVANDYDPVNNNTYTTTNTTYYGSLFHHNPTQKINTKSTSGTIVTNIKYAQDYRIAACDALSNGLSTYQSAVQSDTTYLNTTIGSCSPQNSTDPVASCRYITLIQYRETFANARIAFINTRLGNYTGTTAPTTVASNQFTSNHNTAKASADALQKPILQLQDENIFAPIETSTWKNGNLLGAHYTNYGFVTNPAGYAYATGDQKINLAAPSASFTASAISGNTITADSRYQTETLVNYNNGRIADVTGKNGVTLAYLWGYNNQYPVAKIAGASYAQSNGLVSATTIANPTTTDAAMRTELNKLRVNGNGLPATAMVNSYTYNPVMGMSSETDAQGRNSYYNYDALGRLKYVQDQDNNVVKEYKYTYASQSSGSSGSSGFNLSVSNNTSYTGYTIYLTAVSGGSSATLTIGSTGSSSVGPVVPGLYNISIVPPAARGSLMAMFSISGSSTLSSSGATASFSSIYLGTANYNTLNIY